MWPREAQDDFFHNCSVASGTQTGTAPRTNLAPRVVGGRWSSTSFIIELEAIEDPNSPSIELTIQQKDMMRLDRFAIFIFSVQGALFSGVQSISMVSLGAAVKPPPVPGWRRRDAISL